MILYNNEIKFLFFFHKKRNIIVLNLNQTSGNLMLGSSNLFLSFLSKSYTKNKPQCQDNENGRQKSRTESYEL